MGDLYDCSIIKILFTCSKKYEENGYVAIWIRWSSCTNFMFLSSAYEKKVDRWGPAHEWFINHLLESTASFKHSPRLIAAQGTGEWMYLQEVGVEADIEHGVLPHELGVVWRKSCEAGAQEVHSLHKLKLSTYKSWFMLQHCRKRIFKEIWHEYEMRVPWQRAHLDWSADDDAEQVVGAHKSSYGHHHALHDPHTCKEADLEVGKMNKARMQTHKVVNDEWGR